MSIRAAQVDKHWQRTFARQYLNTYDLLKFTNLFCLGAGEIRFRSGITAIVGGNGVGKSTLAAALGELLEREASPRFLANRSRLLGSVLDGVITESGSQKDRHATGTDEATRKVEGAAITVESWWLDPGFWAFRSRSQVLQDANFNDLVEPLTPIELTGPELDRLNYVVGKNYTRCRIFEIPEYADFDRFPYFRVTASGVEYASDAMGQGELSLLIMLWVLRDLKPNSILVLEEPESHVSPRSQAALMNVIAEACDQKGLWVIVTTHSPTVVARVPRRHVRLLVRDNAGIAIIETPHQHQLAAVLGGAGGFRGALLVEDAVAQEMSIALMEELSPDLLRQLEVVVAGSQSELVSALRAFPRTAGWLRIIGAFDGDQRGKINEAGMRWPHCFLPGQTAPEEAFRDCLAQESSIDALSDDLGVQRQDLVMALDATTGLEPHDWLIGLGQRLALSRQTLVRSFVRIWLRTNRALGEAFIHDLAARYDAQDPA